MSRKTKFPLALWRWTAADESLFSLDKEAVEFFILITREARK